MRIQTLFSTPARVKRTGARVFFGLILLLIAALLADCSASGTWKDVPEANNAVDYPAATWTSAAPRNSRSANRPDGWFFLSDPIRYIVIHTTEGSSESAVQRFQSHSSRVSAHYIISSDGRITQMVREKDIAWHSGNPKYNRHSIGIEHEVYASQPATLTDAMYRSSAALTRYLCLKYEIPMDREHIIGHNEVPDPKNPDRMGGVNGHTDPGQHWDWSYFMQLVTHGEQTQPPPGPGDFPG